MDHRNRKPADTPSRREDREQAAQWRAWIDAALAHYERQGGTRGVFVGRDPTLAVDMRLETEGAHDIRARIAGE